MAKKTVKGTKSYTGTPKADIISVIGKKNKVNGAGGDDTITVSKKGSGHTIYGGKGKDKITIKGSVSKSSVYGDDAKGKVAGNDKIYINGGKKNTIYGGKGADTITINGGSSNKIYGGKGNDVFVIGKNSAGKATVMDLRGGDKVKIAGGTVKNITAKGNNRIITGGKSAKLTLKGGKPYKFIVTDSNGNYTVSSSSISMQLKKSFTGTYTARSFVNNIDARYTATGSITVNGNKKNNRIEVSWKDGGTYAGGAGNDTIVVDGGNNHTIYGSDSAGKLAGTNKITVNSGTGNKIYGGKGADTIAVKAGTHMIFSGDGDDTIVVNSGVSGQSVHGDAGKDTITVSGGNIHSIFGDDGDDVITVTRGVNHHIEGGAGKDTITVNNVTFDSNSSYNNTNGAYINAGYGGKKEINVTGCKNAIVYGSEDGNTINISNSQNTKVNCGHGDDTITISGGNNTEILSRKGTNTISVSGKNVTISQEGFGAYYEDHGAKDSYIVNWSANIGRLTIQTSRPENSNSVDALKINNVALNNLKFYRVDTWNLLIEGSNGNSIFIDGMFSRNAFANGITVGSNKLSYDRIDHMV